MRLLRHLFARSSRRLFPEDSLHRITDAIAAGERLHRGEVMFAVESNLPPSAVISGVEPRERAHEVFVRLRTWDTEANNGVLIYLLLADHRIEIVADRGLAGRVSDAQWREVCQLIETGMGEGRAEQAVLDGIAAASALLAQHFPQQDGQVDEDELPNRPHLLD
ncbi:TLP18.3, Psb32 and MOLO-1 founding protein of phosphatase [Pseudoxanthomonas sp. CF385]|uniref:TPM domain-containing protein n=1 Tax=Pseudoxanthomonas sp. CF385 TaxID=1881042 RepID=UPI00088B9307|nr:TPM domain-containing protein [Pseudoxanthomonas sp. CF385]SDQ42766.1 TLP18.3, Psb32 and MOLO-1 founding protein of phosphatase [Pseudoxanthomonas sp. CF385]